jgi:uncharacterized protein DUF6544
LVSHVDLAAMADLPPPTARYLRKVLRNGQPLIRAARLKQSGKLRTDSRSTRWLTFRAEQVVVPAAREFVWNARVSIMPLIHLRVRDAYVGGVGSGTVTLLSALTLAADRGGRELSSGALHRYLAESVWYPTALLPSDALQWSSIDERKARATLTDSGHTVSLEFWFSDGDEVTGVYSPGRWGKFGKSYRQAPWEGHFSNYREQYGMLVPSEGEVGWYSAGKWEKVWIGRIAESGYEFIQ